MTSGDSTISRSGKRRMKVGCLYTLIIFGLGAYAGLVAAKHALVGPDWMRKVTGITLPPPFAPVIPPAPPPAATAYQSPAAPPGPTTFGGSAPGSAAVGSAGQQTSQPSAPAQAPPVSHASAPQSPPAGGWLVGTWEVIDDLHPTGSAASTVVSDYIFDEGGTGEFDTNGKKQYDLHWEDAGDYLQITFVTDTEGDQNWKVKMKYSINADHNILTMMPQGKKDPRGEMYNVGPGSYHRK